MSMRIDAQAAYDDAVRQERLARIGAADDLRARGRRRRAGVRLLGVAAAAVVTALLVTALWAVVSRSAAQHRLDADDASRTAAAEAITTMLTADPADADGYVNRILDVSTGDQRDRLDRVRPQLHDAVTALTRPATGIVLAAGLVSRHGDAAEVVVVAQASDPTLIGAAADESRVTVDVTLRRVGDRWLVAGTEQPS
ncbi:MAG: hypothetical protein QM774_13715 [Gordonia sp. (in: high G+C Gram-positive bacteria)]|uniref:hypothetical protein n=1 Tax=Gordonia sp. (in: high G+C Gram-positive bacteria) TaxID=84139 RepID=UPI0039E63533